MNVLNIFLEISIPVAVFQSCSQGFESCYVAGELENSQYSKNSENLSRFSDVFQRVLGRQQVEKHGDKERKNAKKVDDVEERNKKLEL